jgi:hypothetical protein
VVPVDNHLTATYDIGNNVEQTRDDATPGIISDLPGIGYVRPATL